MLRPLRLLYVSRRRRVLWRKMDVRILGAPPKQARRLTTEKKTTEMLADNINRTKNEINIDIMKLNNQYNNYNEILLKLNY